MVSPPPVNYNLIIDPVLGVMHELWCLECKIVYRGSANAPCPLCASNQPIKPRREPEGEGNPERNEEMIRLLGDGASLRTVANLYGLSREGVRYIRDKWGKAHGKE